MEVRFENDYLQSSVKVYIFDGIGRYRTFLTKGGIERYTVGNNPDLKDEDILFARIPIEALQAFAEALAGRGIKTNNDHKIEGTLEATKYHLEDMRKIAKVTR